MLLCMQVSAIKVLLNDLKGGLSKVNTEILKAAGVDANSAFAHRQFGDLMMSFHQHAKNTFAAAEVLLASAQHCRTAMLSCLPIPDQHDALTGLRLFSLSTSAVNTMSCVMRAVH